MARLQTALADLMNFSSMLPWQASVGLALVSGLVFHCTASAFSVAPKVTGVAQLGSVVVQQGIHTFAFFLQFIVPAALLIGALVSLLRRVQSGALILSARSNPSTALAAMSWARFRRAGEHEASLIALMDGSLLCPRDVVHARRLGKR